MAMEAGGGDLNKKSKDATAVVSLEEKKLVVKKKLKQELIDLILEDPFEPLGDDEDEVLAGMSEPYRDCHAKTRAVLEALAEFDADIIKQYQTKGYAEVDVLVAHNDDKS